MLYGLLPLQEDRVFSATVHPDCSIHVNKTTISGGQWRDVGTVVNNVDLDTWVPDVEVGPEHHTFQVTYQYPVQPCDISPIVETGYSMSTGTEDSWVGPNHGYLTSEACHKSDYASWLKFYQSQTSPPPVHYQIDDISEAYRDATGCDWGTANIPDSDIISYNCEAGPHATIPDPNFTVPQGLGDVSAGTFGLFTVGSS